MLGLARKSGEKFVQNKKTTDNRGHVEQIYLLLHMANYIKI